MRRLSDRFLLAILITMLTASALFGAMPAAQTLNLPDGGVVTDDDDDTDVVKARVARISFIRGDVKIKRVDNDEWEKAVVNLPLVEGDEIATGDGARLEMQFNNYAHMRLDENAYVKFSTLKDAGVALSLTQGTLVLRITNFDRAGGYYEIDAPKTTVALEKSGSYRIDAGQAGDQELRVAVKEGGSARVYSDDAGFTLKSGRSARVFVEGNNAGEWETIAGTQNSDEFDEWNSDRDSTIAKRLRSAYYDKFYDQDIYGADDLNDNGEWIYTSTYGYVWRPYSSAINSYANWSPYRYGHWRWISPFGWTWINDEPWGWATYHHGRWVYDRGYWVWCPYGYYRPKRSWWFPALVVINIFNSNVCWYPLGYHRRWHNYNGHHGGGWGGNGGPVASGPRPIDPKGPRPSPTPVGPPIIIKEPREVIGKKEPIDEIPSTGIIAVPKDGFGGREIKPIKIDPGTATSILTREPVENKPIDLPDRKEAKIRERDIVVARPKIEQANDRIAVGAAPRKTDAPLDQELRDKRIFGGRQRSIEPVQDQSKPLDATEKRRPTGVVDRPSPVIRETPPTEPVETRPGRPPVTKPRIDVPRVEPTERKEPPPRNETPRKDPPPRYEPPTRIDPPRRDPPPPPPQKEPPPRNDPPKQETKPVERPTVSPKERPKDGR